MRVQEENKTFLDYVRIVFDKAWVVIAMFIIVEACIFVQNMIMWPRYEAVTKVLIVGQKEREIPLSREFAPLRGTIDIARSQVEVIKSEKILRDVVRTLQLDTRKRPRDFRSIIENISEFINDRYTDVEEFIIAKVFRREFIRPPKPTKFEKEVERMKRRRLIRADAIPETDVIQIKAIDFDPQMAAKIANAVAVIYAINDMERQLIDFGRVYKDKHPKITELSKNIKEAHEKLESGLDYKEIELNLPSDIKIAEAAIAPLKPVAPKKILNLVIGAILSIICGIFLIFVLDYTDQAINSSADLLSYLGINTVWSVPMMKSKEMENRDFSKVRENLRAICNAAYSQMQKDNLKSILITSTAPAEGKSTLAYAMAEIMSKEMKLKVVLVDFNFRHPSTSAAYPELEGKKGMRDLLDNGVNLEEVLGRNENGDFALIPCGQRKEEILTDKEKDSLLRILKALKERFDVVILDGPSFQDAHVIASLAQKIDTVLLAIRAGYKRRYAIEKFLNELTHNNAKLMGVVLTFREYNIPEWIYKRI